MPFLHRRRTKKWRPALACAWPARDIFCPGFICLISIVRTLIARASWLGTLVLPSDLADLRNNLKLENLEHEKATSHHWFARVVHPFCSVFFEGALRRVFRWPPINKAATNSGEPHAGHSFLCRRETRHAADRRRLCQLGNLAKHLILFTGSTRWFAERFCRAGRAIRLQYESEISLLFLKFIHANERS